MYVVAKQRNLLGVGGEMFCNPLSRVYSPHNKAAAYPRPFATSPQTRPGGGLRLGGRVNLPLNPPPTIPHTSWPEVNGQIIQAAGRTCGFRRHPMVKFCPSEQTPPGQLGYKLGLSMAADISLDCGGEKKTLRWNR